MRDVRRRLAAATGVESFALDEALHDESRRILSNKPLATAMFALAIVVWMAGAVYALLIW
jgi:hypothetical protein